MPLSEAGGPGHPMYGEELLVAPRKNPFPTPLQPNMPFLDNPIVLGETHQGLPTKIHVKG